jgi:PEP-CTERM motif
VYWNGSQVFHVGGFDNLSPYSNGTVEGLKATAATTELTFMFLCYHDPNTAVPIKLDDVSVLLTSPASPVPLPGSVALLGSGLMGLAVARLRRRWRK